MLDIVLLAVGAIGVLMACLNIHERGHWIVARIVGVPASKLRIVYGSPSRVELKASGKWLAPGDPGYNRAFQHYHSGRWGAWWFVSAGFLLETTAIVTVATLLSLWSQTFSALALVVSLCLQLVYVVGDVIVSARRKQILGDTSAMYLLSATSTLACLLLTIGVKAGLLFVVWGS